MCEDLDWCGNGLKITRQGPWWVVQFRKGGFLHLEYETWDAALDGAQRYLAMEAQ